MYISLVGQKAAPKKCVFLSTAKDVRSDMKCWVVSDAGDKWSVRLDVRDLGGHLDSTFRARAVTLGFRMTAAIPRVRAVSVLLVALYLPWCRALESNPGVRPQLNADNLKCVSESPAALLSAAGFTNMYIRLVGQEAAPKKCVFLGTSMESRRDMKGWVVSDAWDRWTVKLDVRDLGGTPPSGLGLPRLAVRILRTVHLPAALHGAEASLFSISGLRRLRSAFGRAAMSGGLRLASLVLS